MNAAATTQSFAAAGGAQQPYSMKRRSSEDIKRTPESGIYAKQLLNSKVFLKMREVGNAAITKQNLESKLKKIEGKCVPSGYVRPHSVKMLVYSAGAVKNNMIEFAVAYECLVCNPVEGMVVDCIIRTITKAGIYAEVVEDQYVPLKLFIARDHNYNNSKFSKMKENQMIRVRIIGTRFELNDKCIVSIASLFEDKPGRTKIRVHQEETDLPSDEVKMVSESEQQKPEEDDDA